MKGSGPLIVNALGGLANPNLRLGRASRGPAATDHPDVDARSIADARASGLSAVNITLGYVAGPADPFDYTETTIGEWDSILRAHPADLLKVYDQIRTTRGVGAAMLRGGRCEGCHLSLNTVDLNVIRSAAPDEVIRCEECRRILVRTAESGL